jgi:hypothetical protein
MIWRIFVMNSLQFQAPLKGTSLTRCQQVIKLLVQKYLTLSSLLRPPHHLLLSPTNAYCH